MKPSEAPVPALTRGTKIKWGAALLAVATVVTLPFVIWGEDFAVPLLASREHQAGWLVLLAILLLAADSVAPVPATLVIMFLAAKAGWIAGVVGGTVGLAAGVLLSAYIGRTAVGRLAPKFFPDAELARMRTALQDRLGLTLACLRSLPIAAETSVIIAAATGVPVGRIFRATLLPNFLIALIYSLAADDSFVTASVAFLATAAASYVIWRYFGRRR
jgi:uncharacterized membrane protein YdjX (TVP38/TMEM64 family)